MVLCDINVPFTSLNVSAFRGLELRSPDQPGRWFTRDKGEMLVVLGPVQIVISKSRWQKVR